MAQPPRMRSPIRPSTGRLPDGILIGALALVLLIVLGVFAYRMVTRPPDPDLTRDRSSVDSAGERLPGGSDPQPKFGNSRDELEHRGAGERPQGPMPVLGSVAPVTRLSDIRKDRRPVSGQPVELKDVEVESANGNSFWIKDGKDRIAVVGPAGTPALKGGQHVSLSGRVEATSDAVRIDATRVELND